MAVNRDYGDTDIVGWDCGDQDDSDDDVTDAQMLQVCCM